MKKRLLLIVTILLFQVLAYANGDEEQSEKIRVIDDDSIPTSIHRIKLPERPAMTMRPEVAENPNRPEHLEPPERPERPMKPEHIERPERPEMPMRPNRPGR